MSGDHTRLRVFELADRLTVHVYRATECLPPSERYGLQSQMRCAAVSAATNIVEGCTRTTTKDYVHLLIVSLGSASELGYLIGLTRRLGFITTESTERLGALC